VSSWKEQLDKEGREWIEPRPECEFLIYYMNNFFLKRLCNYSPKVIDEYRVAFRQKIRTSTAELSSVDERYKIWKMSLTYTMTSKYKELDLVLTGRNVTGLYLSLYLISVGQVR
jgi:hypothetical protein